MSLVETRQRLGSRERCPASATPHRLLSRKEPRSRLKARDSSSACPNLCEARQSGCASSSVMSGVELRRILARDQDEPRRWGTLRLPVVERSSSRPAMAS
jgi:hypothetical protein